MLQNLFQNFLITAEKPRTGFIITLIAGCTNMLLDWILVGICGFGIAGAAWATVISQIVGGTVPFIYFVVSKSGILKLTGIKFDAIVIAKTCGNGVSEFLSNVSASIVGFLYNLQLMHYVGENGVSAYGVIMYVSFVFVAIYIGYSMGVAPIIGVNYGAGNKCVFVRVFYSIKQRKDLGNFVCYPYFDFAVGRDICPSDTVGCGRTLGSRNNYNLFNVCYGNFIVCYNKIK